LRFVRRILAHADEKAAFGIWVVARDIEGSFIGIQTRNNASTLLINGAFRPFYSFKSHASLPSDLRPGVLLELLLWLSKVIFEERKTNKGDIQGGGSGLSGFKGTYNCELSSELTRLSFTISAPKDMRD
jgi:hypothetical protein